MYGEGEEDEGRRVVEKDKKKKKERMEGKERGSRVMDGWEGCGVAVEG